MKIVRGAATFLIVVAIFAFAECQKAKNEQTETSTTTATGTIGTLTSTKDLPCKTTDTTATLCDATPCIVYLNVKDQDDSVTTDTDKKKVWLYQGQTVLWRGKPKKSGQKVKVEEVRFLERGETIGSDKKGGDKHVEKADCPTGSDDCTKTTTDMTPCQSYSYVALVTHNGKPKHLDPELEVGSTTNPILDTSTIGVSSTTAH